MDILRIDTGAKKIQINDGPDYIEFNPTEVNWGRRFEKLRIDVRERMNEMSVKIAEIEKRAESLIDEDPAMIEEINALRDEVCTYMRGKIDALFGDGTSQKAFGDLMSEYAIASFLEGITPYIQASREPLISKYLPDDKRHKRKVMS